MGMLGPLRAYASTGQGRQTSSSPATSGDSGSGSGSGGRDVSTNTPTGGTVNIQISTTIHTSGKLTEN